MLAGSEVPPGMTALAMPKTSEVEKGHHHRDAGTLRFAGCVFP